MGWGGGAIMMVTMAKNHLPISKNGNIFRKITMNYYEPVNF